MKHLKNILVFFIFLGSVVFLLNLIIDNPYTHYYLRNRINLFISKKTNLRLNFEAINAKILPLRLDLYGLKISEISKEKDQNLTEDFLQIAHLKCEFSIWSILMDKPKISLAQMENVIFIWKQNKNKQNASFLKHENDEKEEKKENLLSWPLSSIPIDDLEIINSNIYYETPSLLDIDEKKDPIIKTTLSGASFFISFANLKNLRLQVQIDKIFALENEKILIEDGSLSLRAQQKKKSLIFDQIELKSKNLNLLTKMDINFLINEKTNLIHSLSLHQSGSYSGDLISIGHILNLEETKGQMKGKLSLDLAIDLLNSSEVSFLTQIKTKIKDGIFDGFLIHDVIADLSLNKDSLIFDDASIYKDNKKIGDLKGKIDFNEKGSYLFDANVEEISFINLMKSLDVQFDVISFDMINSPLKIKGQADPFEMNIFAQPSIQQIAITSVDNKYGPYKLDVPSCKGYLDLDLTKENISFKNTSIKCPKLQKDQTASTKEYNIIEFKGLIETEKETINLDIKGRNFEAAYLSLAAHTPLKGLGDFNVLVLGPFDKTQTKISAKFDHVFINEADLKDITADLIIEDDEIKWKTIQSQKSKIDIKDGSYNFVTDDVKTNFYIESFEEKNLKSILDIFDIKETSFNIKKASGNIFSNLSHPAASKGKFDFDLENFSILKEKYFKKISGHYERNDNNFRLDNIKLEDEDLTLRLGASVIIKKDSQKIKSTLSKKMIDCLNLFKLKEEDNIFLTLQTEGKQEKAKITSLPYIGKIFKEMSLNGSMAIDAKLEGPFSELQGTMEVHGTKILFMGSQMPPLHVISFYTKDGLDVTFNQGGHSLEGRIKIDLLSEHLPFEWYISIKRYDLRAFFTKIFFKDPRNYAYFTGKWYLKGFLDDFFNSVGELNLEKFQMRYVHDSGSENQNINIYSKEPVSIDFSKKGITFRDNKKLELISNEVKAFVSLPKENHPENFKIDFALEWKIHLLTRLFKAVEAASGNINIYASLEGPIENLKLKAHSKMSSSFSEEAPEELSITFADMRPKFQNISYEISYENGLLHVHHLNAQKGDGRVTSQGFVNLFHPENKETQLLVNFKDIKILYYIPYLKHFDSLLSGDLQLTGSQIPYKLTGDIIVKKARSSRQFDIREEVVSALRQESFAHQTRVKDPNPFLNLDLAVRSNQSISINNKNLRLTVSNDLKITGDNEKPVIFGNMIIDKGRFIYRREFDILRGELTFDDPSKIDPKVDILAVTEVGNYRVSLSASGKASSPTVEILVDPPTKDDGSIISRLDAIVLLSRGSLPSNEQQQSLQTQGVGMSEFLTLYSSQLPFDQMFENYSQNFQPYLDWTTDEKGSPVLQLNIRFNVVEGVSGLYSRKPKENKFSLEIPIHEGISSSLNQTFISGEESSGLKAEEGGNVDLRFRFSFD